MILEHEKNIDTFNDIIDQKYYVEDDSTMINIKEIY